MNYTQLDELYATVIEEIKDHLHRDSSVVKAQRLFMEFCSGMIESLPGLPQVELFLKDIVIAFAGKSAFEFTKRHSLLESLKDGTDEVTVEDVREAKCLKLHPEIALQWNDFVVKNPEFAVVVIAICYRLDVERKLAKLVKAENRLAKEFKPQT